jgi:hypothetical protein
MRNNSCSNFSIDDLVFEGVSSDCAKKTRELLEDLDIDISVYGDSRKKNLINVLPKKRVVGFDGKNNVIGISGRQVIIQFPKMSRSYVKELDTVETGKYVIEFTIGNSFNSRRGMNSLSIRRLEDQFTLHFFSNYDDAKEYSEYIK